LLFRKYVQNTPAQYETAWWIDPVSGDDRNTGITVGAPLKTLTEWCRRMDGTTVTQDVTVTCASGTITGDITLTINIVSPAIITIVGNITSDGGHSVTAVTASSPSTNIRGFISSADAFTDQTRVRFTSGTMNNAIAYVTGLNGGTTAYISTPGVISNFHPPNGEDPVSGFPAVSDTYVIDTLNTTVSPPNMNMRVNGSGRLIFQNLNWAFLFNANTQVAFMRIEGDQPGLTSPAVIFYGCAVPSSSDFFYLSRSKAAMTNCWFNGFVASIDYSNAFFRCCVFRQNSGSFGGL
jgi:hypothetical protein